MNQNEVLNPTLYGCLERRFGDVEVVARGHEILWKTSLSDITKRRQSQGQGGQQRLSRKIEYSGEEYRIRCPFCKDHRPRLYVNHRWGVWDEETQSYNLHLAQCFNEQCLSEVESQKQLYEWVFAFEGQWSKRVAVKKGKKHDPNQLLELPPPGPCIQLDELQQRHPRHHAIDYLLSRGLDPSYLGRRWKVSYCIDSRYNLACNRIIIPIFMNGGMVGWQARYVGDDVRGVPFNKANVPKYWTSPGMPRRMVAYNFDLAVRHSTVVIVEGPSDVWAGGPCYMGLIGKTMNVMLVNKFVAALRRAHGEDASVFIMLDPKPDPVAQRKGKPHHIEKLYQQLLPALRNRLGKIYLDEQFDPGDLDRTVLRRIVRDEGKKQKIHVSFKRPVCHAV